MDKEGYRRVDAIISGRLASIVPVPGEDNNPKDVRFVTLITNAYPGVILSELEAGGVLFNADVPSDKKPQLRLMEPISTQGSLTFEDMRYRRPTSNRRQSPRTSRSPQGQ